MQLSSEKIIAAVEDRAGVLTINNPQRRNAISLEMWDAMGEAFTAFSADPDVRCIVMQGAGDKAFASGADISQFEKNRADANAAETYGKTSKRVREQMIACEKPVVAVIRGFCMGGGLGIAMTADMRVAADDAIFGIPAARLGIAYDFLNLRNLVNLVGPSKAKEILITGKRMDANTALGIGLINDVVAVDALADAKAELVAQIAENAPLSMRASKLTINEVIKDEAQRNLDVVEALGRACFDSTDYKEGRTAFMEKRKPVFTGR